MAKNQVVTGVVWRGVVWCGVVWCGVVWRGVVTGVVWCGVVWRGVNIILMPPPLLPLGYIPGTRIVHC
jgi:hypothetical protein